ncbi:MAG: ATP synthase subunit I [Proteobacteria bacterium]|nr:ATP synthase subunit I [Pseudomonadota bacterium]
MSEILLLVAVLFAGIVLGALFFGGLWWTIQKGLASTNPARCFMGSLLLRISITLAGFYFVMANDWKRLLACLTGFVIARLVMTRLTAMSIKKEAGHVP